MAENQTVPLSLFGQRLRALILLHCQQKPGSRLTAGIIGEYRWAVLICKHQFHVSEYDKTQMDEGARPP